MSHKQIFSGEATLEDLYCLNEMGWEVVINNGIVTQIIINRGERK